MKKIVGIFLAFSLFASSAFAEKTVMDKLTNDSAFEQTAVFFNNATSDSNDAAEVFGHAILVAPVAVAESIIWVVVLPFNAIKLGMED